jgi:hypothetical protein
MQGYLLDAGEELAWQLSLDCSPWRGQPWERARLMHRATTMRRMTSCLRRRHTEPHHTRPHLLTRHPVRIRLPSAGPCTTPVRRRRPPRARDAGDGEAAVLPQLGGEGPCQDPKVEGDGLGAMPGYRGWDVRDGSPRQALKV